MAAKFLTSDWPCMKTRQMSNILYYLFNRFISRPKEWRDITVEDVLRMNMERSLKREQQKNREAVESLKSIIAKAVHATDEWNPAVEKFAIDIIVEAENALRKLELSLTT